MGQVIDFETKVDRPCDTEPPCEGIDMAERILKSAQSVEGYKAKHTEPTSSNPFPYVRFHYHNGKGFYRVQKSGTEHQDVQICVREAIRMIGDLASFITAKGGSDD